ncbi:MAG: SIMPL domain-containing protein [Pseudomonadota bacterium]
MFKKIAVVSLCLLVPFAVHASQLPDYPFIHANGSAGRYVAADIGEIDFEVVAFDGDTEAARALVEQRVADIRALMEGQGVPSADVETRDVRKEVRRGEQGASAPTYEIKCSVHIHVTDLTKWREIMLPLLNMPNLGSFATTFAVSDRKQIELELISAAIKDAMQRAEGMAAGLGKKLGAPAAVSSGPLRNLGNSMGLVPSDFRNGGRGQIPTRKDFLSIEVLRMDQPVDVIFRIK